MFSVQAKQGFHHRGGFIFSRCTTRPHPILALLQFDLICVFFLFSIPSLLHSFFSLSGTPPLLLLFIQYTPTPSPFYPIHPHSLSSLSDTPTLLLLFIRYTPTPSPFYPIHPHSLSSFSDTPPLPLLFIR